MEYAVAWNLKIYPFEKKLNKNKERYNNVIKGNMGEESFVHVLQDSLSDDSYCSWMGERGVGKCPVFYLEDLVHYFNRILNEYSYHDDEEVRKIAEAILSFDVYK